MSASSPRSYSGDRGLVDLPPYKSSVTGEDVKFTTLAGRYSRHAVAQPTTLYVPLAPLLPAPFLTSTATPWSPPSSLFNGIVTLQGPHVEVLSANPYPRYEFPAETYVQAKRHVVSRVCLIPLTCRCLIVCGFIEDVHDGASAREDIGVQSFLCPGRHLRLPHTHKVEGYQERQGHYVSHVWMLEDLVRVPYSRF
ncbi:hypothetical protein P691DRAFT_391605 [Macrolepiota fuliginosa MF-IS2]|uniref:Uncharacterized protein n=1 Tax=Macrolepiota fuliginosa MF-IS2 TaxID=1400762 RepID=A0A9P5XRG4_9AGAR|nr:hypothetical protein P691DRAFT_391605 [Macrolepiota fuliginosa MF-IS2]